MWRYKAYIWTTVILRNKNSELSAVGWNWNQIKHVVEMINIAAHDIKQQQQQQQVSAYPFSYTASG